MLKRFLLFFVQDNNMFLSATDFRKATLRIGKVFTYKNAVYFKITFSEDFLRIFWLDNYILNPLIVS